MRRDAGQQRFRRVTEQSRKGRGVTRGRAVQIARRDSDKFRPRSILRLRSLSRTPLVAANLSRRSLIASALGPAHKFALQRIAEPASAVCTLLVAWATMPISKVCSLRPLPCPDLAQKDRRSREQKAKAEAGTLVPTSALLYA